MFRMSIRFLVTLSLIPLLGACSFFETQGSFHDMGEAEKIDILHQQEEVEPQVDVQTYDDGNVTIYSYNEPSAKSSSYKGSNNDSRGYSEPMPEGVEIYPLDARTPSIENNHAVSAPVETVYSDPFTPKPVENLADLIVYFDHDQTEIDDQAKQVISEYVSAHNQGETTLEIEGHASSDSSEPDLLKRKLINLKVSMERAFTIARAFINEGWSSSQIRMSGKGEEEPPTVTNGLSQEDAARRVEVTPVSSY